MSFPVDELQRIVTAIARAELLPRFSAVARAHKADGSVVTEADLVMQQRVRDALAARWPDVAFLGEEMTAADQHALLRSGKPLWLLDPLDGTSNFAAGVPFFSTSLALLDHGGIQLGIVYDPVRDECFGAVRGGGASLNGRPLPPGGAGVALRQSIGLIDFKRLTPELATRLARHPPYASQRSFGSIALDWCWIAAQRGHVYLHGKQHLWDYAAGWLILHETGGCSTTLSGEDVFVRALTPRSAVAAADAALFREWVAWLHVAPQPRV